MKSIATWAPILPGKNRRAQTFNRALSTNQKNSFGTWMKKCGVKRGKTWIEHSSQGDGSVFVYEGNSPERFYSKVAKSNDPFATWFRTEFKEIYGWDLKWSAANWQQRGFKAGWKVRH